MGQKILVVEDAPFVREILSDIFLSMGYQVLELDRGSQVLNVLRLHQLDGIILDLVLPDKNGIEILSEIHQEFPHLPVVGCSSLSPEALEKFWGGHFSLSWFVAFLKKPFTRQEVLEAMKVISSVPYKGTK